MNAKRLSQNITIVILAVAWLLVAGMPFFFMIQTGFKKQFELLTYLVRNRGTVLTRDQLLHNVWGYDYSGDTRTVDVHVRWLREKLEEDAANPKLIQTVRGVGYVFRW